ncbi:MAG TPA: serine/threonine-protein kinase, partial [Thermoanaerobaculia bacterium]
MTLQTGSRLGPYEIVSPIGAGGMGEVYKARDPRLGREVAIKVLPASFSQDGDRLRRFEQEARAAGVLNHPNITAVHDIGSHDGSPYIVTELLVGDTLRARLASGPLPVRKAIDYGVQIARGLSAAHERGIVHRDLKPENVFVTRDGRVKILDFGLAKLKQLEGGQEKTDIPTESPGTEPGVVMGTMGYMSPEQVRGLPVDPRSDIFSLGAVLYELLSGKKAFKRNT